MRDEDNQVIVPEDARAVMLDAAKQILEAFISGGSEAVPPHAIALAHMVEDYLG